MSNGRPVLEIRGITKRYGALEVLRSVSFTTYQGERRAIIGPNGAGKTTLFNVISGIIAPSSGEVLHHGRRITGLTPDAIGRLGLARTFQKNTLFLDLSVADNVCLALQQKLGVGHQFHRPVSAYSQLAAGTMQLLDSLGLADQAARPARELSYGEQRQLELALALAMKPSMLLLDEPTAGMSPAETNEMAMVLARLPRSVTLLIIEHDMDVVFALADRICVLNQGALLEEGTPEQIRASSAVREVYLGS